MNKKKKARIRSISGRINASAFLRMLVSFLLLDLLLLLFFLFPEGFRPSQWRQGQAELGQQLVYVVTGWHWKAIFTAEGVLLILQVISGSAQLRRSLQPLEELTRLAQDAEHVTDEEKFHRLEDAIDRISPAAENAGVFTGDEELAGLESAVNNLMARMREAYSQQARFVSDASHELRTPIAVIQGYANMLDRWGKTDEKVLDESIQAIRTESEHMKKLVEQLLFLARGDSGRTTLSLAVFDLSEMLREVYEESCMIDAAHSYALDADGAVTVYGDEAMLKQTARILIENAAKYTPEGGRIVLRTLYLEGVPAFSVQDNGIGIAADSVPQIFDRFYRADSSRTRGTGGTGLGLAIAKWIVDRHGGWFRVLSREEVGTRITVCLPMTAKGQGEN